MALSVPLRGSRRESPMAQFLAVRPLHTVSEPIGIGDPALPPPTAEDLQQVRLVRQWSNTPPRHSEILQLWHFWPELQQQTLAACLVVVRDTSVYVLGTFERRQARWWQIMTQERGLELQIEDL
ncbi:MAG: hypothetical protein JWQ71_70 [Pedosphaera sp.]|nr:hypothetical protein [Pedosphaera sp.]